MCQRWIGEAVQLRPSKVPAIQTHRHGNRLGGWFLGQTAGRFDESVNVADDELGQRRLSRRWHAGDAHQQPRRWRRPVRNRQRSE